MRGILWIVLLFGVAVVAASTFGRNDGLVRIFFGHWRTFDPRNNEPRIGRVLIAQGRDASDVPITQTFGPNTLVGFKVWTDEIP